MTVHLAAPELVLPAYGIKYALNAGYNQSRKHIIKTPLENDF